MISISLYKGSLLFFAGLACPVAAQLPIRNIDTERPRIGSSGSATVATISMECFT